MTLAIMLVALNCHQKKERIFYQSLVSTIQLLFWFLRQPFKKIIQPPLFRLIQPLVRIVKSFKKCLFYKNSVRLDDPRHA